MLILIFVTVGSRNYQFNRLFEKLDELYDSNLLKDEIFAQIGCSSYIPRNYKFKDFVSQEEFEKRIESADIVISHGASGSIMKALNAEKKVIAVTRLEKYDEHINDHQIQNNEAFAMNKYVLMVDLELDNLGDCLELISSGKDDLVPWINENPLSIIELIDGFIQDNIIQK